MEINVDTVPMVGLMSGMVLMEDSVMHQQITMQRR